MEAKTLQKYAKKSIPQLLETAKKYFHLYIRLRDSENGFGKCISSGRPLIVPSENSHAGHFYESQKYPRLRFHEDNVHLQSRADNYYKSGDLNNYRINLIKKIGIERVEALDLIAANKSPHKWEKVYLIQIIETYKQKVKDIQHPSLLKQLKKSA